MNRLLENFHKNWPTYLFEILVLVIGIFGAFELDNWNDDRKRGIEEKQLYHQLILDYEANLNQLNQKIYLHEACVTSGYFILAAIDRQTADLDSLLIHLSVAGIDVTFDPIKNELNSSGKINLIQNMELNRLVSNWNSELAALRELEVMWQGRVYGQYLDLMMEMGIDRDVESKFWDIDKVHQNWLLNTEVGDFKRITPSRNPPKVEDILQNQKLESLIAFSIVMNQGAIEQSLALKNRINKTLSLLRAELEP